jgi:hypothetical protein
LRIRELEKESQREDFWADPVKAKDTLLEQSRLKDAVANWKKLKNDIDDIGIIYQIS